MAGMLPGVETARRRRLRGSCDSPSAIASGFGSSRFRLSHDTHTSFLQRSVVNQSDLDDKLGGEAREAKQRLDGRLRGHLKEEITRQNSEERLSSVGRKSTTTTTSMVLENLQMEVFGLKKGGSKRLICWRRIWNSSNQDECAICLDKFKASGKVTRLPCTHRFHSDCLLPWLRNNAHCPCCRTTIISCN